MATKIPWANETWNPITGCSPVSAGCKNCYARRMAQRLKGRYGYPADEPFRVTFHPDRLEKPAEWKKPRLVFPCSMGDLFHPDVRDEWIDQVFTMMTHPMSGASHHTYPILTKRPERILECGNFYPWPNIWVGVSVENQHSVHRILTLRKIPAAVRFVSYEPALGYLDSLPSWLGWIDWVIAGCESGSGRRPASIEYFRSMRDRCVEHGVPFFLKQMDVAGKVREMPELDGRVWDQYPEMKR